MTQEIQILKHLQAGNSITQMDALNKFGCFRLASIIHKLRCKGYDIRTRTIIMGKKNFASYKLVQS